jgi:hypothetical protein
MKEDHNKDHPAWLKAMQNGSIGEARARAFLLDRFWVLERSVDVDGADFIIQRRITSQTLLDREAPRLGVVQVKFYGTAQTTHYIHKQYVADNEGKPQNEFFLLCHSGGEEELKAFLLTAEDITKAFQVVAESGCDKYRVALSDIGKYEIKSRKLALDRIENHLKLADFTNNRRFMSWILPSAQPELDAISPLFKEPIDNWWGDIPTGFRSIKKVARDALINVEEIYTLLHKVAEATDPLEAEGMIEDIAYNCRDGLGKWSISLPDGLDEPDFFMVCRQHKEMVATLRKDGVLDAFIAFRTKLKQEITGFLKPHFPCSPNAIHEFTVRYDPDTFLLERVTSRMIDAAEWTGKPELDEYGHIPIPHDDYEDVKVLKPGTLKGFWIPGRQGGHCWRKENTFQNFESFNFGIYYDCMRIIYEQRYGKIK